MDIVPRAGKQTALRAVVAMAADIVVMGLGLHIRRLLITAQEAAA